MKKYTKILALLMAMTMAAGTLSACGGNNSTPAETTPAAPETQSAETAPAAEETGSAETSAPAAEGSSGESVDVVANAEGVVDCTGADLSGMTIGYVSINSAAPWSGVISTTFQEQAKAAGATVNFLDAQTDAAKMAEYSQQMIDTGVDALVIFGGDPNANADIAKTCAENDVALFMAALDVGEAGREYTTACVGPDQEQMCYDIGQYIIEANGADAGSMVVQISGVPFLDDYIQREAGFARAMEEANYDVKPAEYAYSSRSDAKTFMENFLTTYGDDIDILMGYDDDLTMGAVAAIDEAGKTGTIKVYSLTGQNDAIQAVADGKMELTVINRAGDIACELVNAIDEYFATGTTAYYHRTPLTYVTADNVADYIGKGEF